MIVESSPVDRARKVTSVDDFATMRMRMHDYRGLIIHTHVHTVYSTQHTTFYLGHTELICCCLEILSKKLGQVTEKRSN